MLSCYRCEKPFIVDEPTFVGDRCTVCKETLLEICTKCFEEVKRIGVFGKVVCSQELLQIHIKDKHSSVELID